MFERLRREPVVLGALARIIVGAAGKYGFELTPDQVLALLIAAEPIVSIIIRQRVSPVPAAPTT